jgi:hypothetical protein
MTYTRNETKVKIFRRELSLPIPERFFGFLFIAAIIALSVFFRMYHIATNDMWVDEANTVLNAEKDLSGIISSVRPDGSPPLYHFMLHYWMAFFGQTETAVRSLSALFGVLLVVSLFFVGRKLFSLRTGVYAALISAMAPIQIMYSQQVRMYSLLPLTSLVSMYFLVRYIQDGTVNQIFWYAVSTVACMFTHHYGLMLLSAQAILVVCFGRLRKKLMLSLVITGSILLRFPLWMPILLRRFSSTDGTGYYSWMNSFWDKYGFWGSLLKSLQSFSPGGAQPPYVPLNALSWQPVLPVVLSAFLLLVGLSPLIRRKQGSATNRISTVWLLVYGLIPLFAVGIYSIIFSPIYLAGRCDQLVFPAFCLLLAAGISNTKPSIFQYALVIVVALFSLKTLDGYYESNPTFGDKEIAESIRQNLSPGDAVLCTSLTRASLEYYLRDKKSELTFFSYPPSNARHLAHQNLVTPLKHPEKLISEVEFLEKEIRYRDSGSGRFFLVYVPNRVNMFLRKHINRNAKQYDIKLVGRFKQSLLRVPVQVLLIKFKE